MQKFCLEEGSALFEPVDLLHIDKRQLFDLIFTKTSCPELLLQPDIEDDLTDPAVETALEEIQAAGIHPVLQLEQDIEQPGTNSQEQYSLNRSLRMIIMLNI